MSFTSAGHRAPASTSQHLAAVVAAVIGFALASLSPAAAEPAAPTAPGAEAELSEEPAPRPAAADGDDEENPAPSAAGVQLAAADPSPDDRGAPRRGAEPASPFAAFLAGFDGGPYGRLWDDARRFYAERDGRPAWLSRGGEPSRAARRLVEALAEAERHGLDAERYGAADLAAALDDPPAGEDAFVLEARLTGAFLLYADHLAHGRAVTARWPSPARRVDLAEALARATRSGPGEALDELAPRWEGYRRLVDALAEHREIAAAGGWGEVPAGPALEPGRPAPAERLRALAARLEASGDLAGAPGRRGPGSWFRRSPPPEADAAAGEDVYDEPLADAVRRFQRRHGLAVDGVVGPATLAALNVPVERRIEQIALNLERWRWLADDLGARFVLVDLGGQELVAYDGGRPALRMNVVVGTPRTATPILASAIESVVVNPAWYVPASIVRNEIRPRLARDPGYLGRNGYHWLPGGGLRQRPGPGNALGHFKFVFPNRHSVYLHDTPSRDLFDRPTRAFSHGCVRVADPRALAEWLLEGRPERDRLDRLRAHGSEHRVPLADPVPVHLLYWTASVGADGEVRFPQDVYGRDGRLLAAM